MQRVYNSYPPLPEKSKLICELDGLEKFVGYAIDEYGNVWTCKAHNFSPFYFKDEWCKMKAKNNAGYLYVILSAFGFDKTLKIHRLVGMAFISNPNSYPQINHIDTIKGNNAKSNLEWVTSAQNIDHMFMHNLRDTATGERLKNAILKDCDIPNIFAYKIDGLTNKEIAKIYSIEPSVISRIIYRKRWKHVHVNDGIIISAQAVRINKNQFSV